MKRIIKTVTGKFVQETLDFVEKVFTEYSDEEEGNPQNYQARGFYTSADYGIVPGETLHLPDIACLMVKELELGALERIKGQVNYDFYEALR